MYYWHIAAHTHFFCNHHKDLCCILILSLSLSPSMCFFFLSRDWIHQYTASYSFSSTEYVFYGLKIYRSYTQWEKMAGKLLWLILTYVNFTDIYSFSNVCSSNKPPFTSWHFSACAIISGFSKIQCRYWSIEVMQCVERFGSWHFSFIQSLRYFRSFVMHSYLIQMPHHRWYFPPQWHSFLPIFIPL